MADESVMLALTCPSCGQRMKVPQQALGKSCRCVKCGNTIAISEQNTQPAGAPPAAPGPQQGPSSRPAKPPAALEETQRKIGQMLLEDNRITAGQLDEALAVQSSRGGKTLEILLSLGHLTYDSLHEFFSKQPGIASINLRNYDIDKDLVKLIPKEFALERGVIPIDKLGRLLTVAMVCPLDHAAIREMEQMSGLRVKAMLCREADLKEAVDRYYGGGEMEEQKEADFGWLTGGAPAAETKAAPAAPLKAEASAAAPKAAVARPAAIATQAAPVAGVLPVFPDSLARLKEIFEGPGNEAQEMVEILGADPPLAATLLRMANSAAYGLPGKVNSIGLCVTLLGVDGVKYAVEDTGLVTAWRENDAERFLRYRNSSVFAAFGARLLAEACELVEPAPAFAAALLLDIGRYALAQSNAKSYPEIAGDRTGGALLEAERSAFNTTHPEVGMALCGRWRFPEDVAITVGYHHAPQQAQEPFPLLYVAAAASSLSEVFQQQGARVSADAFGACAPWLSQLGLSTEQASQIYNELCVNLGVTE